ncbi:ammonium transporter [Leptolyngbya sp. Heron Island J]|uniref:ammonium transporter n=1 Tax=Leptolyngbya sp. Heron Island J TaxID=1385935 RepID=UPI0003FB59D8|nr:ammonium transporter [Leptolyngbya sp. Heron Island J]
MSSHTEQRVKRKENRSPLSMGDTRYYDALVAWMQWINQHRVRVIFLVSIWFAIAFSSFTFAQDNIDMEALAEQIALQQGYINVVWILVASTLVVFMNAGFGMLEVGMCRQKNAVNILSKNLIVFGLALLTYWAVGFGFMFGQGTSLIGFSGFFMSGDSATYGLEPFPAGLPVTIFFLFQAAFAATSATIVSGAVAERIRFDSFLIFSVVNIAFYCISGKWSWGGGWLADLGFADFAGSTVVHSVGGWSALVGAIVLGARYGKYEGKLVKPIPGHNLSLATLGCLILWIGWFGFNPGSELAANENIAYIAITTNLSGAAGGTVATMVSWVKNKKPDLGMVINGVLAGLVGITAGCDQVSFVSAIIIGCVSGVLVVFAIDFFDALRIDDPVGAISVHLCNGIWATLAVGIFGANAGLQQFWVQLVGVVAYGAFTVITGYVCWQILKMTIGIRVHDFEEIEGLDIHEHGQIAYAGFSMVDEAPSSAIETRL